METMIVWGFDNTGGVLFDLVQLLPVIKSRRETCDGDPLFSFTLQKLTMIDWKFTSL